MLTIVACDRHDVGNRDVADAKDERVRYEIVRDAEFARGQQRDYVVLLDGMESISVGLTLLRLLVEVDVPHRLAMYGAGPDIRPLIDAWEHERLEELTSRGRLVLRPKCDDSEIVKLIGKWGD